MLLSNCVLSLLLWLCCSTCITVKSNPHPYMSYMHTHVTRNEMKAESIESEFLILVGFYLAFVIVLRGAREGSNFLWNYIKTYVLRWTNSILYIKVFRFFILFVLFSKPLNNFSWQSRDKFIRYFHAIAWNWTPPTKTKIQGKKPFEQIT